ncbi:MAG: hypothetical protein JOY99_06715 [Sphingomonadaceae bacterium]|nr:hypothetical protein [Sphingomonadaceae bacterium]
MATLASAEPGVATGGQSALSWSPVFGGAVVMIATTLILLTLGAGLGFAAASPWPGAGPSATTFAVGVGIWLIATQWVASFLGGYVTGRLRTRWTNIHTHEVLFRDTAHGLVAWALATVIVSGVALSATLTGASAASNTAAASVSYATDTMLRTGGAGTPGSAAVRDEAVRILGHDGTMAADDRGYLTTVVARQTGVSQDEAAKRVDTAVASIRAAADKARKVSSATGFFTALSLLIGAFIASVAAAYGGRLRDEHADLSALR